MGRIRKYPGTHTQRVFVFIRVHGQDVLTKPSAPPPSIEKTRFEVRPRSGRGGGGAARQVLLYVALWSFRHFADRLTDRDKSPVRDRCPRTGHTEGVQVLVVVTHTRAQRRNMAEYYLLYSLGHAGLPELLRATGVVSGARGTERKDLYDTACSMMIYMLCALFLAWSLWTIRVDKKRLDAEGPSVSSLLVMFFAECIRGAGTIFHAAVAGAQEK